MLQKTLSLDPARILAVDDDELVQYHYRHLLSSNGYEVELAKDAEEALHLLEQQPFDLILLDLRMPGMGEATSRSAGRLDGRGAGRSRGFVGSTHPGSGRRAVLDRTVLPC